MPKKAQQPLLTDWVKSKVTGAQKKRLQSLTKKTNRSESHHIRAAIDLYLKQPAAKLGN